MRKIKIEKYLDITESDKEECRKIKKPLTLKQMCYMQCSMEALASKNDPRLNDFANRIAEMLFDKEKFKKAGSNFFVKLEAIINKLRS